MNNLKKYQEFYQEFVKKTDELILSSLSEEFEMVRNIYHLCDDLQDECKRVQMWLNFTIGNNEIYYLKFDKDLNFIKDRDYESKKDKLLNCLDVCDGFSIDVNPQGSSNISKERYLEIRNDIINRVESIYPFVRVDPISETWIPHLDLPTITFYMKKSDLNN